MVLFNNDRNEACEINRWEREDESEAYLHFWSAVQFHGSQRFCSRDRCLSKDSYQPVRVTCLSYARPYKEKVVRFILTRNDDGS